MIYLKKKNISTDIDDQINVSIAKLSGILTGVLTLQISLTKYSKKISKTGKVLNALPKMNLFMVIFMDLLTIIFKLHLCQTKNLGC